MNVTRRSRWIVALLAGAALVAATLYLLLRDRRPREHAAPEIGAGGNARIPQPGRSAGDTAQTPPSGPLAEVEGVVRDVLTSAALGGVDVIFAGEHGETTATSQASGRYHLAVPPGRYLVRASGEDLYGVAPEPLVLEAGARVTTFDLQVARLAQVSGRVVDAAGQPAPGATVTFRASLGREEVDSRALEPDGSAQAAGDGGFTVRVTPGEVELSAERNGRHALLRLPYVAPAARLNGIELVLPATARLAGLVRDERGPVAGASVLGLGPANVRVQAASGADGTFVMALPAGAVRLQARAQRHADSEVVTIDLPAAGREGVQLTLRAAARIRGRVLLPDGRPAAGATVQARRPAVFDPLQARTDSGGAFALEDLGPEAVDLIADLPPFASARLRAVRPPRDGVTLQLQERGRITGAVRAAGAPVVDFTVRIERWTPAGTDERIEGWGGVRRLASDGRFVLENLQPGTFELVFAAPGFAPARRGGLVVRPGADTDGSVELERGAVLEGTVREARTDRAVAGARVSALTGHEGDAIYTDEDGRFVLDDIAPGRRSVEVFHPSYVSRSEGGIVLRAGERRRLDVSLTPADAGRKGGRTVEFAGIGAVLSGGGELPRLERVLPGSPAEVAGLAAGDLVAEIDGESMVGAPLSEVIEAIRGVAGTAVRLALVRDTDRFTVDVVRGNVRFQED